MSSDQKKKKITLPEGFTAEFHFQPMEGQFPNLINGRTVPTFLQSLCHSNTQTSKHTTREGNYRLVFIINIDAKIFNKILAG